MNAGLLSSSLQPALYAPVILPQRDACLFSAERALPCGAIVRERDGKIISKTIILTAP